MQGGCLYIDEGAARVFPVWPSDTWLNGSLIMRGDHQISAIGESVRFTGGFLTYDLIRRTMDADIPAACRGGQYFLISGNSEPSPSK